MSRQVLLPAAPLTRCVRHFMVGGFDSDRVHLPACADVQLLVYLRGGACLIDPAGAATELPRTFLVGAVTHPRQYQLVPGSRFMAATFRPGGLHACLGMSAADVTGTITRIDHPQLLDIHDDDEALSCLQSLLESGLRKHAGNAIHLPELDLDALNRPVADIARELGIGVRQFERQCLINLGMPLRDYRRLARYSAAMTALMMQGATPQALASLAQDARYVDQAHFTRDFAAMVGTAPGRFLKQRGDAQYRLWQFTREELETYLA